MNIFVDKLYAVVDKEDGKRVSMYFYTEKEAKNTADTLNEIKLTGRSFTTKTYGLVELGEMYEYNN